MLNCTEPLAVDSMSGVDGASGAAKRRRERRQRSWLRHEQLSVKMALSAALHHSRGVGPELHEAPRGPKTDRAVEEEVREVNGALEGQKRPPPGTRPGVLQDPGPPWVEAVTVGYVAAGAPSLVVAPVAGARRARQCHRPVPPPAVVAGACAGGGGGEGAGR